MKRPRRTWFLGLLLAAAPLPFPAPPSGTAIVPSQAIGPYQLEDPVPVPLPTPGGD
jgi:hypothetical protein